MPYLPISGMTPQHFDIFARVSTQQNRIIVVRNTNEKSTPWIAQGYPPKPKELDGLHTAADTGKVTATNVKEKADARRHGFYVIDEDGIARGHGTSRLPEVYSFKTLDMHRPGQVIHPQKRKALVGDYDLMGVIDPDATGRVIALATSDGIAVANRTNPDVEKIRTLLNSMLDQPRVMHGPQDLYKSFRGGCTAFLPDGTIKELRTQQETEAFYASIRRQTITGKY